MWSFEAPREQKDGLQWRNDNGNGSGLLEVVRFPDLPLPPTRARAAETLRTRTNITSRLKSSCHAASPQTKRDSQLFVLDRLEDMSPPTPQRMLPKQRAFIPYSSLRSCCRQHPSYPVSVLAQPSRNCKVLNRESLSRCRPPTTTLPFSSP